MKKLLITLIFAALLIGCNKSETIQADEFCYQCLTTTKTLTGYEYTYINGQPVLMPKYATDYDSKLYCGITEQEAANIETEQTGGLTTTNCHKLD